MRKVIFGGANSLDNFFARKDNSVDWLMWSDEAAEIMKDLWPRFDCMVMGRKTYEVAAGEGESAGVRDGASARDQDGEKRRKGEGAKKKNPFGAMKTYVFSRTLEPGEENGVEILREDPGEFVRKIKAEKGKDIMIMGGGNLARSLFEAGVIDEIGFNIHPVLLGSGIPLFYEMSRQIDLELIECRPFKNGCVYVLYRVKNQ